MTPRTRIATLAVVAIAIGAVFVARNADRALPSEGDSPVAGVPSGETAAPLPRLVDLGSDKCVPCKMMAPILDELARDCAGSFRVEVIDVWKDREAGSEYGIQVIPTQIFFDAAGVERWRHEGFLSKEDILAKWKELGVRVAPPAPAPGA